MATKKAIRQSDYLRKLQDYHSGEDYSTDSCRITVPKQLVDFWGWECFKSLTIKLDDGILIIGYNLSNGLKRSLVNHAGSYTLIIPAALIQSSDYEQGQIVDIIPDFDAHVLKLVNSRWEELCHQHKS